MPRKRSDLPLPRSLKECVGKKLYLLIVNTLYIGTVTQIKASMFGSESKISPSYRFLSPGAKSMHMEPFHGMANPNSLLSLEPQVDQVSTW